MEIMLGNLTIKDIENRLEIKFSNEDKVLLENTYSHKAELEKDRELWHCFDIPFRIHCNSLNLSLKIKEILKRYEFKNSIQISFELGLNETIESHYEFIDESGYPKYLFGRRVSESDEDTQDGFRYFYILEKISKKSVRYRRVGKERFMRDFLGLDTRLILSTDYFVPSLNQEVIEKDYVTVNKEVLEKSLNNRTKFTSKGYCGSYHLKAWMGEKLDWDSKF